MKIKNLRPQLILAAALMLFGFGAVTQLRSYELISERLEVQSESDLVEIVDGLDLEIGSMRSELTDQKIMRAAYEGSAVSNQEIMEKIQSEQDELEIFVGRKPASGPGVSIEIRDRNRFLTGFDLRQIIEELRSLGAWAIAINGHRLDYRSSLFRESGRVFLDGRKLKPKYVIEAIGEPRLMFQTFTMSRGVRDKLNTLRGVRVRVRKHDELHLDRFERSKTWEFAKVAPTQ